MRDHDIPLVTLNNQTHNNVKHYSKSILENEIHGVHVEHVVLAVDQSIEDLTKDGCKSVYLFMKGSGTIWAGNENYEIVPETVFLPNAIKSIKIRSANTSSLHYLKISCELTAQDCIDLNDLPIAHTQKVYCKKFSECQSYSEAIKSSNTVSRTIVSNEYIPRVAMGTVQTTGPDKVGAHEHPMLEQLFLGLSDNNCTVYADNNQVEFPPHSILHIPLGSSHWVSVEKDKVMHYVWMDFFLDKDGEEWLKTHKHNV